MSVMSQRDVGVMSAIARFEGRKLLTSGPFLAGIGIALLGSGVFLKVSGERSASWEEDAWTMAVGFMLLSTFTLLATNRAALRDSREHTSEQHASLPVSPTTRTGGLLLAAAWPTIASAILLAAVITLAALRLGAPDISSIGLVHLVLLMVMGLVRFVLLMVMFSALGVALASWFSNSFIAPVITLAFFFVSPGEDFASWHVLWPFTFVETTSLAALHLVYFASLTVAFGVIALARFGMRRRLLVTLVAAVVTGGVAIGIVMIRVCPDVGRCLS